MKATIKSDDTHSASLQARHFNGIFGRLCPAIGQHTCKLALDRDQIAESGHKGLVREVTGCVVGVVDKIL